MKDVDLDGKGNGRLYMGLVSAENVYLGVNGEEGMFFQMRDPVL